MTFSDNAFLFASSLQPLETETVAGGAGGIHVEGHKRWGLGRVSSPKQNHNTYVSSPIPQIVFGVSLRLLLGDSFSLRLSFVPCLNSPFGDWDCLIFK